MEVATNTWSHLEIGGFLFLFLEKCVEKQDREVKDRHADDANVGNGMVGQEEEALANIRQDFLCIHVLGYKANAL